MALPARSEVTLRPLGKSSVRPHRSAIAASWEKDFPAAPVSHRQPLGKTCCRASPAVTLRQMARVKLSLVHARAPAASALTAHPADAAVTTSPRRRRKSTCWGRLEASGTTSTCPDLLADCPPEMGTVRLLRRHGAGGAAHGTARAVVRGDGAAGALLPHGLGRRPCRGSIQQRMGLTRRRRPGNVANIGAVLPHGP